VVLVDLMKGRLRSEYIFMDNHEKPIYWCHSIMDTMRGKILLVQHRELCKSTVSA
jgi:hypothetical protein